ncbi:MAG: penicillin-binding protein 2, partial [Pacificimonas sp.]
GMSPGALRSLRIQLAGKRQAQLRRARQRMVMGMAVFGCLTMLTGARLFELALINPSDGRQTARIWEGAKPRAAIVDRNGADLARSFKAFYLAVKPREIVGDPERLAQQIAGILGDVDPADIEADLTAKGRWRYVQRRVQPDDAVALKALGEPGLEIGREWERVYPNRSLAAHVLGYTSIDGQGQAGLEQQMQTRLSDPELSDKPVALSIDTRVQHAMVQALTAQMKKHDAIGGSGIVMDVHTGELLALTSQPVFDPNAAGRESLDSRFNRATYGVYELGSTLKALTIATAIDTGTVTSMGQGYDASHPIRAGRFTIRDFHGKNRWLSVPEIFMYSSNIGTAKMALEAGVPKQKDYLRKLGMLEKPPLELAERGYPLYPDVWGEISAITISYGHGISVTPLHLAAAYSALVNGGIYHKPTLLKLDPDAKPEGRRVFKPETSRQMNALLRLVVKEGTGGNAEAEGYRVGGKTGTADKPQNGGYNRRSLVTTFAAAFPMDNPRYVVIAMLDEPKGIRETYGYATAGWTAAPVVSDVVSRIAPVLGVDPSETKDIDLEPLLAHVRGKGGAG